MFLKICILLFGAFTASTAVIMIKICTVQPVLLASLRLLVAAVLLTPLFIRDLKKENLSFSLHLITPAIIPGILLGLHLISWIIGARMTPAANSTLIVNMVPIVMPFIMFFMLKETINKTEIAGTILSMTGVFFLARNDFQLKTDFFTGDIICFLSMIFLALYLAMARKHLKSIWLYMVPLYYIGGIFSFIVSLFFVNPFKSYTITDTLMILGLGIIPTIMGHTILNYSMKVLRPQVVSLVNLSQFIFAGIMAFFMFSEVPSNQFYTASLFILIGAAIVILFPGKYISSPSDKAAASGET